MSVSASNGAQSGAKRRPATRPQNGRAGTRSAANRNKPLVRPAPRSKIRRARLVVAKVDTWSVAKLMFLLSVAVGIVIVVTSVVLWLVLQATGAFDGINDMLTMLGTTGNHIDISQVLSLGQVALYTTILAVVNVILFTLLSVICAMLYNIAAKLVGGIGLTLTDD
ncbi:MULTISPECIES: DUF3566 domain-containing protein [Rothia]|uniref:DUF3566 domain-containing protein n=1 Tax=Rothia TaxID=32207 RepID=UPI00082ED7A3|nr:MULTISPECIES: DUF3566 domain-containing protein [Rothia]